MTVERVAWALLVLLVFSAPWDRSIQWQPVGTLARFIGWAAFTAGAVSAWKTGAVRRANLALVLAGVFCVWCGLSLLWSIDRGATISRTLTLAQLLAMTGLIWNFCRTADRLHHLMAAFAAGAVVTSIMTLARYGLGIQTYWRRYAAPGFDPNDTGVTIAIAIPMALYLAHASPGAIAWLWRGALMVMLPAILVTASRTALLAALVGFVFAVWTWRSASWPQRLTSVGLVLMMALSLVRLAPAPARQRLQTLPSELTRGTLNKRTSIWKAGLKVLRGRPVLGVGAGAYPTAVDPLLPPTNVAGHVNVAHNTFLSVLVECGIAGFAAYASMLFWLALFVWSMFGAERALWATMLIVWAVGVSTVTWEHRKVTWVVFALIMAAWPISFGKRSGETR